MEVLVPSLLVVIVGVGRAVGSSNSSSSAQSGRLQDDVSGRQEILWQRYTYFASLDIFLVVCQ